MRLLFLITFLFAGQTFAAKKAFDFELPHKKFIKLNVFERAQYKKAYALVQKRNYKSAVDEFEKFKQQHPENSQMAYVVFMKAYCLHQAKRRNEAIKVYNEVVDYFGDDVYYAAAALYYMAEAHFDNGDIRSGLKSFKEMADDKEYSKHPLAAGAFRYLADNSLKNKKPLETVRFLKLIAENFYKENKHEADIALGELAQYYILSLKFNDYEKYLVDNIKVKKPESNVQTIRKHTENVLRFNDQSKWIRYTDFKTDLKSTIVTDFLKYYRGRKSAFSKNQWSYHSQLLDFVSEYAKKEFKSVFEDTMAYCESIKEEKARDEQYEKLIQILLRNKVNERYSLSITAAAKIKDSEKRQSTYSKIVDSMIHHNELQQALILVGRIEDKTLAAWKKVSILTRQKKYNDAVKTMDDIAKSDSKQVVTVKKRKASLFDKIGKYSEAIKLYREVGAPPGSLWSIAECYHKMKNTKMAITTLTELENAFPDSAPDAALRKTHYYQREKNKKMAISSARRILKMYPKSKASSQAHQILEEYGISTGGGVIEEE